MTEQLNRFARIKSLLQDTQRIDSHTISLVVAECDMVLTTSQPAQAGEVDLHAAIMNLPCDGATLDWANTREAYQYGHRDARHAAAELVLAPTQPAAQATPEPSRGMIGMGSHALANELAQAVAQDDADPDGHDMSAGLFGPNVSAWLRKVATEYLSKPATPPQQAAGEPVVEVTFVNPKLRTLTCSWNPDAQPWPKVGDKLFTHPAPGVPEDALLIRVIDAFERRERGIPQAHIAAALVAELRNALAAAQANGAGHG